MARAGEANGGAAAGERAVLPSEVEGVFREFCTCEFSTLARDPDHLAYGDPVAARGAAFRADDFDRHAAEGLQHPARPARLAPVQRPDGERPPETPAVLVQG